MKTDPYEPLPIDELLDLLSKNWGVPYDAEKQVWDHVVGLRERNAELEAWKASAQAVLNGIDLQAVGKELGIKLGQDIGPLILPGIQDLKARLPLPTAGGFPPIPEGLDPFHVHEAVDRLHVVICMIEEHVTGHPLVEAIPSIKDKIDRAVDMLANAYQEAGAVGFDPSAEGSV